MYMCICILKVIIIHRIVSSLMNMLQMITCRGRRSRTRRGPPRSAAGAGAPLIHNNNKYIYIYIYI